MQTNGKPWPWEALVTLALAVMIAVGTFFVLQVKVYRVEDDLSQMENRERQSREGLVRVETKVEAMTTEVRDLKKEMRRLVTILEARERDGTK